MSDGYDILAEVDLPRLVAAALRADSWVAGFFGAAGIRDHDDQDVRVWTPAPPYCAVLPGRMREQRRAGSVLNASQEIVVRAYLPATPPVLPSITPPPAPSAVAGAAGALTGTRYYALTGYTSAGESAVLDTGGVVALSSGLALVAQRATVTVAASLGFIGRRLWATKLDGHAPYYHSLIPDDSTVTVTDNLTDAELGAELAPIRNIGRRVVGAMKTALVAGEALPVGGNDRAYAASAFEDAVTRTENNVRVHEFTMLVPLRMDVYTRRSTVTP